MKTLPVRGLPGFNVADFAFAVPNGMQLPGGPVSRARYMAAAKRRGLKPGVSDVFVSIPAAPYHGLYIEMKSADGKPTADQLVWVTNAKRMGYEAQICQGFENAKDILDRYLSFA